MKNICKVPVRTVLAAVVVLAAASLIGSPRHAAAQDPQGRAGTWDNVKQSVGSVLESKEERYRREQMERDSQGEQERLLAEQVRRQQEELRRIEEEKRRLQGGAAAAAPRQSSSPSSASGGTEVFIASSCDDCLKAIGFLDGAGVAYRVYNLESNQSAKREYLSTVGRGIIPAIRVGDVVLRGYDPQELRRLFGRQPTKSSRRTAPPPEAVQPQGSALPPAAGRGSEATEDDAGTAEDSENQFDISGELGESEPPDPALGAERPE